MHAFVSTKFSLLLLECDSNKGMLSDVTPPRLGLFPNLPAAASMATCLPGLATRIAPGTGTEGPMPTKRANDWRWNLDSQHPVQNRVLVSAQGIGVCVCKFAGGLVYLTRSKPLGPKAQSSLAMHHSSPLPDIRLPSTRGLHENQNVNYPDLTKFALVRMAPAQHQGLASDGD